MVKKLIDNTDGPASSAAVMQTLAWMRRIGFKPVPLQHQSKAAINRDYVSTDYVPPPDDLWRKKQLGIGCVTGPAHGGGVDCDLDCEEALFFAPRFMPPTSAVFGRKSKPRSHLIYRVDTSTFDTMVFRDPITQQTIIELRGDNGSQTVFPGSLHEDTGELIEWADVAFPDVPLVPATTTIKGARKTSIATVIVRHIWTPGYHNEPTKHLTGLLYNLEWTLDEVEELITAIMDYTHDDDKSRMPTVRGAYRRGEAGKKITGAGVLRKQLKNDALVDKIQEWAGSPSIGMLNDYNERFAVVSLQGKFRIADTDVVPGELPVFFQKDDWLNMMATDYSDQVDGNGKAIPKPRLWLANPRRRTYRSVEFMPGLEESAAVLNLWTGWAVEPKDGDCSAWLELLRDVICSNDDELYRWMLHWFANIVREPMEKSRTAPVLIGPEGAGKTMLLDYFGTILGRGYTVITNDEHLHGKFNAHLGHTLLLHSDEALYAGDKKHAGILRSLITDKRQMLEKKGIDALAIRSFLRVIITSNELYSAPAKAGDRRYTVVDMRARKLSPKLQTRMIEEQRNGGPAALFHYLLEMDYDPNVAQINLKNDSLVMMKEANMSPVENWWRETLATGVLLPDFLAWAAKLGPHGEKPDWPEVVSSVALYVSMSLKMRERGTRGIPSETMLAYHLNKFVGVDLRRSQREYSNPYMDASDPAPAVVKQMSSRQSSIVNMPGLAACRAAFESYIGQTMNWPTEDDTPKPQPKKEAKPHDKF